MGLREKYGSLDLTFVHCGPGVAEFLITGIEGLKYGLAQRAVLAGLDRNKAAVGDLHLLAGGGMLDGGEFQVAVDQHAVAVGRCAGQIQRGCQQGLHLAA